MKSVMIRLSLVENVNKFVNVVSRYPFEMDLRAGRHVVDAKSILGIDCLPPPEGGGFFVPGAYGK